MSDENNNTPNHNHGNIAPLLIQDEMRECFLVMNKKSAI